MTRVEKPEWSRLFGSGPPTGAPAPAAAAPIDWADVDQDPPTGNGSGPAARPYEATDDSNARRLVDDHLHDIRYCPERRQWLTWDGHRWRWDHGALTVTQHARAIADHLPTNNKDATKWRTTSLMQPRIQAMVGLARADAHIITHAAQLDRQAFELNTPGGVSDLKTAQMRDPDPSALHTRSTIVAPDFEATPERWLRFLATTFAGDPELTTYVQRLLGVSLVGKTVEQLFPVCYGEGRNGKGVLLDVVQKLLGTGDDGYAAQAATELIIATRFPGHPTELARLNGVRFVITSEVDEGQRFNERRLKDLTGGDTVNARFMGKDFFDFEPTHMIWLRTNHPPKVTTGGYAVWERMRLLPFVHTVPAPERIKDLSGILVEDEGPAILAWLITGAADYFAHGLAQPDAVTAATRAYELDQDTVARFVEQRCQLGDKAQQHMTIQASHLHGHYQKWCSEQGEQPVSQKAFTQALAAKFEVFSEPTRSHNVYRGIRFDDVEGGGDPGPTEPEQTELDDPDDNQWRGPGRW